VSAKLRVHTSTAVLLAGVFCAACGGGSSTPPNTIATSASNVQTITVDSGPTGGYANGVFTSVTVCVPSSSNCQTISGVLVDTGSYGLRLLSSAGGGALTLTLPQQTASNGDPIGECTPFVSAYTWGSVATADVTISGEKASSLPLQVIDPTFASVPSGCSSSAPAENDTLQTLGANGILGVGLLVQDCPACALTGSSNPGLYYQCSGTTCTATTESLSQQVQNPVAAFATDNNGVIVELPQTSTTSSLSGSLVFGIGTQSNNGLASATVFPLSTDPSNSDFLAFNTAYNGQTYQGSFIDSGSNAYFFLDQGTTGLLPCGDFYCPNSQQNLSATVSATGGGSSTVKFSIGDANSLFSDPTAAVFPTLGGPSSGGLYFDWGLPFFFGRNVFTAINGAKTPGGTGPYWAF
jgi:hypothetical protein